MLLVFWFCCNYGMNWLKSGKRIRKTLSSASSFNFCCISSQIFSHSFWRGYSCFISDSVAYASSLSNYINDKHSCLSNLCDIEFCMVSPIDFELSNLYLIDTPCPSAYFGLFSISPAFCLCSSRLLYLHATSSPPGPGPSWSGFYALASSSVLVFSFGSLILVTFGKNLSHASLFLNVSWLSTTMHWWWLTTPSAK